MVIPLASVLPVAAAPNGAAAGSAAAPPPAERAVPAGARALRDAFGVLAGSATLLGALALYFGVVYTNAQTFYFGVDGTTLGLSSQEYVLRSVDALFVPVGALALGGLALVGCHALITRWLAGPGGARHRTRFSWALGGAGALLVGLAVRAVLRPLPFRTFFLFAPLSLVVGILALTYAAWLRRGTAVRPGMPPWTANLIAVLVGLTVIVGVFWGMSDYARALGRGRAQLLHARLPARPGVVVYSASRLHLEGPGVEETHLGEDGSDYTFRYAGLRLFTRAGGAYVLLPTQWSAADGKAYLLRDDERVRIEFAVGASA